MEPQDRAWREHIDGVCAGDEAACREFWQKYGPLIERVAERHLAAKIRRRVGPESVVLSVCRTFFRRAQEGEFQFADEEAPWRLLCAITVTKIREKARFHARQKRGLDRELHAAADPDEPSPQFDMVARDPPPDVVAEFNDQLQHLIESLPAEEQKVLELRLEHCTQDEIAHKLQCSERTVRRMMKRIQTHLARLLDVEPTDD